MSKILIVSGFKNAQELLTEAQIRYIYRDDTIVTVDGSDKSGLNAAIAGLDADQDVIYVLGNISDTGIITSTQETALEAKLTAETGELVNYTSTDQSVAVDMAFQAWRDLFGTDTTPSPAIIYTSDLLANLTTAEEAQGAYLGYSIVARYYGNLGTDETLYELWSLLDRGLVPDSLFRPAVESKLAFVNYSALLLTDLLNEGLAISNYMTVTITATPETGTITINPKEPQEFAAAGEAKNITVTASGEWGIANKPEWITGEIVENKAILTAEANNTGDKRTGDVVFALVSDATVTATLAVTQLKE